MTPWPRRPHQRRAIAAVPFAIALGVSAPAGADNGAGAGGERNPQAEFGTDGLTVEFADGAIALTLGGRLMLDLAAYSGGGFGDDGGGDVRRARVLLDAGFYDLVEALFEYDFADPDAPVTDALLRFVGLNPFVFTAGQFEEPFSLEELTSSNDITFMERALPNALVPGRSVGVAADLRGESWSAATGLFGGPIHDGVTEAGLGIGARATYGPRLGETTRLHLGLAGNHRFGRDVTAEFASRPESHVTGQDLFDTGEIPGTDTITRLGLEVAVIHGPVSLQGEYMRAFVDRDGGQPNAAFDGGYVQASWFVTGETRPYDPQAGVFGRVEPRRNVTLDGGTGAIEVAARFSFIDLEDAGVAGGRANAYTLGANWYLNPNVRLMGNTVRFTADGPAGNDRGWVFQTRLQLAF